MAAPAAGITAAATVVAAADELMLAVIPRDEMTARIAEHRARRPADWITLDAPLDLPGAIRGLPEGRPVLVDCLTRWLTNLILAEQDTAATGRALLEACAQATAPLVLVSNEVGLGIVPDNKLARDFRDHAGRLNQRLAARADHVLFVAAGLPLYLQTAARGIGVIIDYVINHSAAELGALAGIGGNALAFGLGETALHVEHAELVETE